MLLTDSYGSTELMEALTPADTSSGVSARHFGKKVRGPEGRCHDTRKGGFLRSNGGLCVAADLPEMLENSGVAAVSNGAT